mgnify:CR=1 FL=1
MPIMDLRLTFTVGKGAFGSKILVLMDGHFQKRALSYLSTMLN